MNYLVVIERKWFSVFYFDGENAKHCSIACKLFEHLLKQLAIGPNAMSCLQKNVLFGERLPIVSLKTFSSMKEDNTGWKKKHVMVRLNLGLGRTLSKSWWAGSLTLGKSCPLDAFNEQCLLWWPWAYEVDVRSCKVVCKFIHKRFGSDRWRYKSKLFYSEGSVKTRIKPSFDSSFYGGQKLFSWVSTVSTGEESSALRSVARHVLLSTYMKPLLFE